MDIEEDLKILQEFTELDRKLRNYKVESDYDNFCERRCVAIDHILAEREEDKKRIKELEVLEDDLKDKRIAYIDTLEFEKEFIPKQKVKEELEETEKENEPYEKYNKESRAYWINQGKISLAKTLLEDK